MPFKTYFILTVCFIVNTNCLAQVYSDPHANRKICQNNLNQLPPWIDPKTHGIIPSKLPKEISPYYGNNNLNSSKTDLNNLVNEWKILTPKAYQTKFAPNCILDLTK